MQPCEEESFILGLSMNVKKTKVMAYNQNEEVKIMTTDGSQLEVVYDFKYLGSWIDNTEADLRSRKAEAWRACTVLKTPIARSPEATWF